MMIAENRRFQKLQRRSLVPLRCDHRFRSLALMIDGPPEIAELAVDLHEDLIQMPTPLDVPAHMRNPALSDLGSEHRAKPVPPKTDGLMADVDPAFGQEILDVAQRPSGELASAFSAARTSDATVSLRPLGIGLEDIDYSLSCALLLSDCRDPAPTHGLYGLPVGTCKFRRNAGARQGTVPRLRPCGPDERQPTAGPKKRFSSSRSSHRKGMR
jgi:hypothetical protein